jgi:hypothetical protein
MTCLNSKLSTAQSMTRSETTHAMAAYGLNLLTGCTLALHTQSHNLPLLCALCVQFTIGALDCQWSLRRIRTAAVRPAG